MKVEVIKPIQGFAYFEGDVLEMEDSQARSLIESGHVIQAKSEIETAEGGTGENAALKTAKGKGKK